MKPTAIDLFCGAGGLSRGLVDAGFQIVGAVDNWSPAIRSYTENFPDHGAVVADLRQMSRADIKLLDSGRRPDLLAGGPPCQGFSIQRIGSDADDRNDLVFSFGEAVEILRPRMFLMENVPGLLGRRGRPTFDVFMSSVHEAGYEARHYILDAADFGVPQVRKRVFIIGWDTSTERPFDLHPVSYPYRTVQDALGDLPEPPDDFSPSVGDELHRRMRISPLNLKRLALIPPGGGFEDLPVELRVNCHKAGAAKIGHRNVYGRLHPDKPASTITARFDSFTRGKFAHPTKNRNITLREGAILQSFPTSHQFFGTQEEIAAQIGNSIPPLLAQRIGSQIAAHLHADADRAVLASERQLVCAA